MTTSPVTPAPDTTLFLGDQDNCVAQALRALEVPHETATVSDLVRGKRSLFDHSVIVIGMDVQRRGLGQMRESLQAFVEHGGVVLAFRAQSGDTWLPSPVKHDRAYQLGK
ncbi:MAG: hypothetical protein ACE5D3_07875, partial [Candidatus Binatia bacterium]